MAFFLSLFFLLQFFPDLMFLIEFCVQRDWM